MPSGSSPRVTRRTTEEVAGSTANSSPPRIVVTQRTLSSSATRSGVSPTSTGRPGRASAPSSGATTSLPDQAAQTVPSAACANPTGPSSPDAGGEPAGVEPDDVPASAPGSSDPEPSPPQPAVRATSSRTVAASRRLPPMAGQPRAAPAWRSGDATRCGDRASSPEDLV